MREYLVCDMCTATVSTQDNVCEFCGNDFKNSGSSAEILQFKDEIEKKIYSSNIDDLLNKINISKFKEHPIILFRKAKAMLIDYMTNDGILDSDEFCNVIQIINSISKITEDYWTEFVLYLTVLFPTNHTKLYLKDFKSISAFLSSINRDEDKLIESVLIQQVLISEAGITFFKDYKFYTDPQNFINNKDFITKRDHLILKYENLYQKIKQQSN
jgi:hypothetical protein